WKTLSKTSCCSAKGAGRESCSQQLDPSKP
ncbi:hypothetical protein AVDCRST_MAG82-1828, partial [uncultured Rubrobacteraceae bacterium]